MLWLQHVRSINSLLVLVFFLGRHLFTVRKIKIITRLILKAYVLLKNNIQHIQEACLKRIIQKLDAGKSGHLNTEDFSYKVQKKKKKTETVAMSSEVLTLIQERQWFHNNHIF